MKPGRVFWGVLFVAVGVLVLMSTMGWLSIGWGMAWRLWPLLLIAWGVVLLVKNTTIRWIAAGVGALLLSLMLASIISVGWDAASGWGDEGVLTESDLIEVYDTTITHANLRLESGAGVFRLRDTTDALIHARTATSMGVYQLDQQREGTTSTVRLRLDGEGSHGGVHVGVRSPLALRGLKNEATLRLNPAPVWDMDIDIGAAKLELDLTPFSVDHLTINAGASSLDIRLGDRARECRVRVEVGASSIRIRMPATVGCELSLEAPVSSKRVSGLEKVGKHLYRSNGFETAGRKVYLDINAGVSSVKVVREENGESAEI